MHSTNTMDKASLAVQGSKQAVFAKNQFKINLNQPVVKSFFYYTDMKSNFRKYRHGDADTLGEPYDYDSIMHYPEYAFSSNYRPTIVKKRQGPVIGQRTRLSAIDIRQVRDRWQTRNFT